MRGRPKLRSRRYGQRQTRPTGLIVCEGTETEPRYFEAIKRHLRVGGIKIEALAKDPSTLIEETIKMKKRNEQSGDARFDSVWVVFDTERHGAIANLPNLMAAAKAKNIQVALSCPSFEIWLLLHFKFSTGQCVDCDEVISKLEKHIPGYDKVNYPTGPLMELIDKAQENAQKLRRYHSLHGVVGPGNNPSTDVDMLVAWIMTRLSS